MLQEDLRQNGRRHAQKQPHPVFPGDDDATATSTPPSSTSDTSTTSSSVTTTSPDMATDMPHAVFVYPTALLTLNNIDVVQVGYRTIWESVNLTVFCEMGQSSNKFALARINEIQSNGTYAIAPIQAGMQIPQFPTYCNFMLCNANNSTDYTTGAGFTMVSTRGIATTYGLAVTQAATASSFASVISTRTTRNTDSAQAPPVTSTAAVSSSTVVETAASSISHSSGLDGGAKAGIALGVILGISALIACFFFFRMKRRMDRLENMVTLRSTASSANTAPSEKAEVKDSTAASRAPIPSPSPPPPPDSSEPKISVFKIGGNRRNSEDWRRFFGNGNTQTLTTSS